MEQAWLKDEQNRKLVGMLIASNLAPQIKELWMALLPNMSKEDKEKLISILSDELRYEGEAHYANLEKLLGILEENIKKGPMA